MIPRIATVCFLSVLLISCSSRTKTESDGTTTYLDSTRKLTRAGRYEEALQRHLWFDRHILETDTSMKGVRRSFALSYWVELGERYPPAIDSFKRIRDEKTNQVINNGSTLDLFADIVAMNNRLDEDFKSIALYEAITHKFPAFAKESWRYIINVLLHRKRYDLIQVNLDNPMKAYDVYYDVYQRSINGLDETEDDLAKFVKECYLNNCRQLIQYCTAINDHEATKKIESKMSAMDL